MSPSSPSPSAPESSGFAKPNELVGLPLRVPASILCGHAEADSEDPHGHTSFPVAHITPMAGWGSDPHGPLFWKGNYHMFHQSRPATCQWFWGMRWDHLVSKDLITWMRLPPALLPTPGWLDADGCFTGNIQVHPATGVPMLFYTGARLRHNPSLLCPEPPQEARHELMLHWETQLCAMADPDDELLVNWTKVAAPWMELPPCAWLTSWRDPYFVPPELDVASGLPGFKLKSSESKEDGSFTAVTQPCLGNPGDSSEREHMLLIGSGLEGLGGTALIYRSKDLAAGWRFAGFLCTWPNLDTGVCWECPHLLHLPDLPTGLCCVEAGAFDKQAKSDAAQDRLLQLVNKAWEDAGMTPAQMWTCVPVSMPRQQPIPDKELINELVDGGLAQADESVLPPNKVMLDVLEGGMFNLDIAPVDDTIAAADQEAVVVNANGHARSSPNPSSSTFSTICNTNLPSNTLQTVLELNRNPSLKDVEVEQAMTEVLMDESVYRTRTAQASADASTITAIEPTSKSRRQSISGEGPPPRSRRQSVSGDPMASFDADDAQSLLMQQIMVGRQLAQQALVNDDGQLVGRPLSPTLEEGPTEPSFCNGTAPGPGLLRPTVSYDPTGESQRPSSRPTSRPVSRSTTFNFGINRSTSLGSEAAIARRLSTDNQAVAPLCDVKAAHEAGLAGLGYAGVLSHCAPEPSSAISGQRPSPPFFAPGSATKEERHEACRKYAVASAAVQGFDLGLPASDSDVVRRCKHAPTAAPEPARPGQRWFFGIAPDAATYGILYFIGDYKDNRFDLETAAGPYKLDLGNALYAPVAFYDEANGRHLLWGYVKELTNLPPPPSMCNKYVSSGCVSLPRALYMHNGRVYQVPLPEMNRLREGTPWKVKDVSLSHTSPIVVPEDVAQQQVDIELVVRRGKSDTFTFTLDSWRVRNEGAAAIRYTWSTNHLEVVLKAPKERPEHMAPPAPMQTLSNSGGEHSVIIEPNGSMFEVFVDPNVPPVPDMNPDVPEWIRMKPLEAGGTLCTEEDVLQLRIFIDASTMEIFTGTGQALTTRVYRGWAKEGAGPKMKLSCTGGAATVDWLAVHRMKPTWLRGDVDSPLQPPVSNKLLQKWLQSFK